MAAVAAPPQLRSDESQPARVLANFWQHSRPKGGSHCNRDRLAAAVSIDAASLPTGDSDGNVSRENILAWLFGGELSGGSVFGEAVQARAASLLAQAEVAPSLDQVWSDGQPGVQEASNSKDDALWQQCLVAHGAGRGMAHSTAGHLLEIARAGFDANKVIFPHKPFRHPAPVPPFAPLLESWDVNASAFPVPGAAPKGYEQWTGAAEEDAGQMWQAGLARDSSELRVETHGDSKVLDTELVHWPMAPLSVIDDEGSAKLPEQRTGMKLRWSYEVDQLKVDPEFFSANRWLRAQGHGDATQLNVDLTRWPAMETEVIANDVCTPQQLEVLELRAKRGPLSEVVLARRRGPDFNPRILEEVRPILEKDASRAEMTARWACDKARAARELDEAAELGALLVAWPVEGQRRWPKADAAWTRHCRWFAMWRRSRVAAQAGARKMERSARRGVQKLARADSDSSGWEAVSECSDASWQALSECSDSSWMDLATDNGAITNMEAKVAEVQRLKEMCQKDLEQAMPALKAAADALDVLCKADITELKAMKAPPVGVVHVSQALCACFNIAPYKRKVPGQRAKADDYWGAAQQKIWGNTCLLANMMNYDKDNMPDSTYQKLLAFQRNPNFDYDYIKKCSAAAAGCCKWIHSIVAYSRISKELAPKRALLKKLEADLASAEASLVKSAAETPASPEASTGEVAEALSPQRPCSPTMGEVEAQQEKAVTALQAVSKSDIVEIKSFGNPPVLVSVVLEAVATVLGLEASESSVKRMISDTCFLSKICSLDMDCIDGARLCKVRAYTARPDFCPESVGKVSKAAMALCLWVHSVDRCAGLQPVKPRDLAPGSPCGTATTGASSAPPSPSAADMEEEDGDVKVDVATAHELRGNISEMKSLCKPPAGVGLVMEAVMHLLEGVDPAVALDEHGAASDVSWKSAQKVMSNPQKFLDSLMSLKQRIDQGTMARGGIDRARRVQQLLGPGLDYNGLKKLSKAAAALYLQVANTIKYYDDAEH